MCKHFESAESEEAIAHTFTVVIDDYDDDDDDAETTAVWSIDPRSFDADLLNQCSLLCIMPHNRRATGCFLYLPLQSSLNISLSLSLFLN